jgi:hypothetical protein
MRLGGEEVLPGKTSMPLFLLYSTLTLTRSLVLPRHPLTIIPQILPVKSPGASSKDGPQSNWAVRLGGGFEGFSSSFFEITRLTAVPAGT